ncbi:PDPN isoform 3 [Pongo abelii]|uniref:PDPN isoform 3 n=1 Tax=Pongo abelii TaxID=9601 RepID=A0A2J8S8U2_PONAB|nr:PDPN isoform 3 [Pongo abelii]
MLTPLGKFSTAKFAVRLSGVWEARVPSRSGAPAPTPPAPTVTLLQAGPVAAVLFNSSPSSETCCSARRRATQRERCGRCQPCSSFWEAHRSGFWQKEGSQVPLRRCRAIFSYAVSFITGEGV